MYQCFLMQNKVFSTSIRMYTTIHSSDICSIDILRGKQIMKYRNSELILLGTRGL